MDYVLLDKSNGQDLERGKVSILVLMDYVLLAFSIILKMRMIRVSILVLMDYVLLGGGKELKGGLR